MNYENLSLLLDQANSTPIHAMLTPIHAISTPFHSTDMLLHAQCKPALDAMGHASPGDTARGLCPFKRCFNAVLRLISAILTLFQCCFNADSRHSNAVNVD